MLPLLPDAPPVPAAEELRALDDERLMRLQRELAVTRRRVDAASAAVAGELARRSARELGFLGLAQRVGARTPEKLVSALTGVSAGEARAMVTVGEAMGAAGDHTAGPAGVPWMVPVAERVEAGELSVGAAAAIRSGLGEPTADVGPVMLTGAARRLLVETAGMAPEEVARRARELRDQLDADRVADREQALRARRGVRLFRQPDGMTRISGLLDPESAALVTDAIDRVTAPRRGGVRFVDPGERQREAGLRDDTRTTEQLAVDALVHMIRLAAAVDDGQIFGVKAPAVRVHVRLADLQRGTGAAVLEGQGAAVGIPTVQRRICNSGVVPILFDDHGRAMDVGRTQRLHTTRQRIAITARDGGCLIPGCDRPPSWCEVHHIVPWEHGGRTSVDDGILLCHHHHMWVHDTGRQVTRTGMRYHLTDPGGGQPVTLASKHPLQRASA